MSVYVDNYFYGIHKRITPKEFAGSITELKEYLEADHQYTDEGEGGYQTQSIKAELYKIDYDVDDVIIEANITEIYKDDVGIHENKYTEYFSIDETMYSVEENEEEE